MLLKKLFLNNSTDNPTYNSPELTIKNFKLTDMGFYQCHVTRYLNNRSIEKFTSINQCELKVDEIPERMPFNKFKPLNFKC